MYVITTLAGKKVVAGGDTKCHLELITRLIFKQDCIMWKLQGRDAIRHSFVQDGTLHRLLPADC